MRFGALVPSLGLIAAIAVAEPPVTAPSTAPDLHLAPASTRVRRSIASDVDAQVLAHLFAASFRSDFNVAVSASATTCACGTCRVAVTVRLPETAAPLRLSFAVASPKGELSDVKHADCLTSVCSVQLVVERGRNTIAVGAADSLARTSGFAVTQIDANAPMSARKTEWF